MRRLLKTSSGVAPQVDCTAPADRFRAPVERPCAFRDVLRGERLRLFLRDRILAKACLLRSEEHTSELQSRRDLVCRLLLEKKKKQKKNTAHLFKKQASQSVAN